MNHSRLTMSLVALLAFVPAAGVSAPKSQPGSSRDAGQNIPSSIAALLKKYPQGGPELTGAVVEILTQDSTSAAAVVAIGNQASPEQAASIALGILQALQQLDLNNSEAARQVRSALRLANPTLRAVLAALSLQHYGDSSGPGRINTPLSTGGFSSGGGGSAFVAAPFVSPN
jgi:hypothetical protein